MLAWAPELASMPWLPFPPATIFPMKSMFTLPSAEAKIAAGSAPWVVTVWGETFASMVTVWIAVPLFSTPIPGERLPGERTCGVMSVKTSRTVSVSTPV
jgi:hypothetical protein